MVLQHAQGKATLNASVDTKGAHEILTLAEDLFEFDGIWGSGVHIFQKCSHCSTNALVHCPIFMHTQQVISGLLF